MFVCLCFFCLKKCLLGPIEFNIFFSRNPHRTSTFPIFKNIYISASLIPNWIPAYSKSGFQILQFLALSLSLSLDFRYLLLALQHVWRRRRKCRRAQNRRRYLSLPLSLPTYIYKLFVFICFLVWWAEFLKAKCLMNCEVALILEHKYDQLQQMSDDPRNQVSQWVLLSFLSIVISKIVVMPWFMNLNLSPANPAYDYVDCLAKKEIYIDFVWPWTVFS